MFDNERVLSKKLLEPPRPCPNRSCTSSNGFNIWEKQYETKGKVIDGYCFVCRTHSSDPYGDLIRSDGNVPPVSTPIVLTSSPAPIASGDTNTSKLTVEDGLAHPIRGIPTRGISYATAEYFGVRIGVSSTDGITPIYTLFPRHRKGDLVGFKTRTDDKRFYSTGGNDVELFGAHLCKPQGKKIYITEGEYDALSLFQALKEGSSFTDYCPAVVSLPTGSASAVKSLIISSALLDSYDEIVLVFDNDEAGKLARDEVCKAYAGKVSYVTIPYPFKDANDMLVAGKVNDLKWLALTGSKKHHPDGIIQIKDLKASRKEKKEMIFYPYPPAFAGLNKKVYGARPGTVVTLLAGTSVGKTAVLHEWMYHFLTTTDQKVAGMFLEEDKDETVNSLLGLHLHKRITLPDVNVSEVVEDEAFDELFQDDRASLYDFFGGMDDSSLLSKLRYYAVTGHQFIFLDHLSFIISETATDGDERKKIDVLMNKLSKFAKEFNVTLFVVVHVKKSETGAQSFEMGAVPNMDDAKGSSSIKQASWDMFALSRNQQHTSPYCRDITEVTVLKCRLTGETGVADYVHFNKITGRMAGVECPAGYREVLHKKGNFGR